MIFQTLDDKSECVGYYYNNELVFKEELPTDIKSTWSYSAFLKDKEIDYAQLYCNGKSIDEMCPEFLKEDWNKINKQLKSILASCIEAKVNLKQNCFYDLAPKRFLIEYCDLRNKITEHTLKNATKPKQYGFYKRFTELLTDIKHKELNINLNNIQNKLYKESAISFYKKIANGKTNINYNLFGSITGRLTVKKDSFPILTFPKQYRSILSPTNDWFVSFDMNAAELRTALALMGKEQPEGDLHQWSIASIYNNELTRAEAKETTTSWLYNSNSKLSQKFDKQLSHVYDKEGLKNKYWLNGFVNTPFHRKIESDEYHAISYLNQSTFIDLFHRQIIKIDDFLKNKKSFVSFLIHDEFVLDMSDDEKNEIVQIMKLLENTPYGKFPVSVKAGKNFGDMKKLNLKVE